MNFVKKTNYLNHCIRSILAAGMAVSAIAVQAADADKVDSDDASNTDVSEEITVRGRQYGLGESRAVAQITLDKIETEIPAGDVLNLLKKVPGVHISQGDAIGGNDWSTRVYIRGMSNLRNDSQIGYMIDNVPNGNSRYGGGAKPNRFTEAENVRGVAVAQNAADLGSASNEALGGTVRYLTRNPSEDSGAHVSFTTGDFNLRRGFYRYDTGEFADGARAYISFSDTFLNTWIAQQSGEFTRQHLEAKIVKDFDSGWTVTGRVSLNDRKEDDYDSVSLAQFAQDPDNDGYTDIITGNPDVDSNYRPSSAGDRKDNLTYVEFTKNFEDGGFFRVAPYVHNQTGNGSFAPGYELFTSDGTPTGSIVGRDSREYFENQFLRGANGGFVDLGDARQDLSALPCLTGRYSGGTSRLAIDPGFVCPADSVHDETGANIRQWSRRLSLFKNNRFGATFAYEQPFGNHTLSAGLWIEKEDRDNDREWYEILRPQGGNGDFTSIAFDRNAYFIDFQRNYQNTTTRVHVGDSIVFGADEQFKVDAGLVWHRIETDFSSSLGPNDRSDTGATRGHESDELLPKLSLLYRIDEGVEVFGSYSKNMRWIPADALNGGTTAALDPELSDNFDIGVRWFGSGFGVTATAFTSEFENRIGELGSEVVPDRFLSNTSNLINIGGVDADGFEVGGYVDVADFLSVDFSFSSLDTEYTETDGDVIAGNPLVGVPEGIFRTTLKWKGEHNGNPITANLDFESIKDRPGNFANSESIPDYDLMHLSVRYSFSEGLIGFENFTAGLNINNLLDEDYLSSNDGASGGSYFLGSPRTVSFTFSANF
ncbi:TonB-dependent receptor domain-containing protein [Porticoccus sp. GXU_MW_L64]